MQAMQRRKPASAATYLPGSLDKLIRNCTFTQKTSDNSLSRLLHANLLNYGYCLVSVSRIDRENKYGKRGWATYGSINAMTALGPQ
eukprot:5197527-Amphidinium_carterae.1